MILYYDIFKFVFIYAKALAGLPAEALAKAGRSIPVVQVPNKNSERLDNALKNKF